VEEGLGWEEKRETNLKWKQNQTEIFLTSHLYGLVWSNAKGKSRRDFDGRNSDSDLGIFQRYGLFGRMINRRRRYLSNWTVQKKAISDGVELKCQGRQRKSLSNFIRSDQITKSFIESNSLQSPLFEQYLDLGHIENCSSDSSRILRFYERYDKEIIFRIRVRI
jgi:hypothetical protein